MVGMVVVVVVYWPSSNIGKNAPTWLEPILAVPTTNHPLAALSGETKITMHQSEAVGGEGEGEGKEGGRVEHERTLMDHLLQLFCWEFLFFSK